MKAREILTPPYVDSSNSKANAMLPDRRTNLYISISLSLLLPVVNSNANTLLDRLSSSVCFSLRSIIFPFPIVSLRIYFNLSSFMLLLYSICIISMFFHHPFVRFPSNIFWRVYIIARVRHAGYDRWRLVSIRWRSRNTFQIYFQCQIDNKMECNMTDNKRWRKYNNNCLDLLRSLRSM